MACCAACLLSSLALAAGGLFVAGRGGGLVRILVGLEMLAAGALSSLVMLGGDMGGYLGLVASETAAAAVAAGLTLVYARAARGSHESREGEG